MVAHDQPLNWIHVIVFTVSESFLTTAGLRLGQAQIEMPTICIALQMWANFSVHKQFFCFIELPRRKYLVNVHNNALSSLFVPLFVTSLTVMEHFEKQTIKKEAVAYSK